MNDATSPKKGFLGIRDRDVLFRLFFVLLMCLIMSGAISLANLLIRNGVSMATLALWPKAWALGFVVAFPVAWTVVPFARKVAGVLTDRYL